MMSSFCGASFATNFLGNSCFTEIDLWFKHNEAKIQKYRYNLVEILFLSSITYQRSRSRSHVWVTQVHRHTFIHLSRSIIKSSITVCGEQIIKTHIYNTISFIQQHLLVITLHDLDLRLTLTFHTLEASSSSSSSCPPPYKSASFWKRGPQLSK